MNMMLSCVNLNGGCMQLHTIVTAILFTIVDTVQDYNRPIFLAALSVRLAALAKEKCIIPAGKICACHMRRWAGDLEQQEYFLYGGITSLTHEGLSRYLERHVTYEEISFKSDAGKLALAAAWQVKTAVIKAGWLTQHGDILHQKGHFPLGVQKSNGTYRLFMDVDRPERTAYPRAGAVFLDLEAFPEVVKSIESKLTDNCRPLTGSLQILAYFGKAHIRWHNDATGISYDTPIRIQEAIPVPDDEGECRSEVVFASKSGRSGHHEFDEHNDHHKIYNRLPTVVTRMTVDCVASGSCKRLSRLQRSTNALCLQCW